MTDVALIRGDARHIPLADSSVQAVVTSPPYWGLRKYAGAQDLIWDDPDLLCKHQWTDESVDVESTKNARWNHAKNGADLAGAAKPQTRFKGDRKAVEAERVFERLAIGTCIHCGTWRGGFGLEPTIEMYIAHTVEILSEIRRVLRPDGVVFWNLGDSYASSGGHSDKKCNERRGAYNLGNRPEHDQRDFRIGPSDSLKPKDLCLIPERVAIAAQADGWWVRSMIIWAKPNPMPESVTDRPTDSYEHIIMLTKSERYFWDADAVREPAVAGWNGSSFTDSRDQEVYKNLGKGPRNAFGYTPKGTHSRGNGDGGPKAQARGSYEGWTEGTREILGSRNLRNVWMFATQPYRGAHFATFPEEIPRRCILAATSENGCCATCGAPWARTFEKPPKGKSWNNHDQDEVRGNRAPDGLSGQDFYNNHIGPKTVGWKAGCTCFPGDPNETRPCLVLDPFGGSGTTARVAVELNRRAVSLDLAYHDHAEKRTRQVQRRLVVT